MDFVLISVLMVFLLFAVLQVAVFVYARNIVASAAADGARYGATAGVDPAAGGRRARALVADGLNAATADSVPCNASAGTDPGSGLPVTTVRCTGHLRALFLPLRLPLTIDVSSSALREGRP